MNKSNGILIAGGILSMMVAVLHIVIIIGGADWYRFFGAGEKMAVMAAQGSWIPRLLTFSIAIIFFVWGLYAFSGAGIVKHLPLLKVALITIAAIYLLRGLIVVPALIIAPEVVDAFFLWSSLVSLIVGLVYAIGTKQRWPYV